MRVSHGWLRTAAGDLLRILFARHTGSLLIISRAGGGRKVNKGETLPVLLLLLLATLQWCPAAGLMMTISQYCLIFNVAVFVDTLSHELWISVLDLFLEPLVLDITELNTF